MGGRALGRVAEHGDARDLVGEVLGDGRGGEGDVAELFGGGFGDDTAISEKQGAVATDFFLVEVEDHEGRGGEHVGEARDDLEDGAEGAGGVLASAADEGIGSSGGEHHSGEVAEVAHGLASFDELEALVAAELLELGGKDFKVLAAFGLDEAHTGKVEVELDGVGFDSGAVAEEDGHAHAASHPLARGLKDARIGAFGEDHALRVALELFDKFGDEWHDGGDGGGGGGGVNAGAGAAGPRGRGAVSGESRVD